MEFGSPPHLYYCLTYDDSCDGGGEVYDDLWYGYPTRLPLPQSCNPPDTKCEGQVRRDRGGPPPGHEHQSGSQHPHGVFINKGQACKWLRDNYAPRQGGGHPGRPCEYYKIPYGGGFIWAVMVPSPTQAGRYFGIQTDEFSGAVTTLESATATPNKNRTVIRIEFNNASGDKGLIWAKDVIP